MTRIGNFDWVKKLVKMGANVTAWDNEPIKTAVEMDILISQNFLLIRLISMRAITLAVFTT